MKWGFKLVELMFGGAVEQLNCELWEKCGEIKENVSVFKKALSEKCKKSPRKKSQEISPDGGGGAFQRSTLETPGKSQKREMSLNAIPMISCGKFLIIQ